MKKLAIFVAALVLALGLAQCKKEQPATPQNTEGNLVHLTVNVGNGSRADVDTITGVVSFSNGDKLYVGYNNTCVGTLDYSATTNKFSGNLSFSQNGDQPLHFYYLGGDVNRVGETQQYIVDISEQYENPYPVISYGTSTTNYSESSTTYSTTLENQCALVEFTTNWIRKESRIYIQEINNQVIIDFANHTFTPTLDPEFINIKLYPETPTNRWAILLPNEDSVTVNVNVVGYIEKNITIPPVHKNDFLHGENAVSFELTAMEAGNPLTMTVMGNGGTIFVSNPSEGMKYSINSYDNKILITEDIEIPVSNNDDVHFYGNGTNGSTNIIVNTNVMLTGNIMSLVDEENFATITTMEGASFAGLFAGNNSFETIIDVSGLLLPATTLSKNCYSGMFAGCSKLSGGPAELPALTLAPGCYSNMFKGCGQISEAPHLPATELVDRCYKKMFNECSILYQVTCLATTINGTDCTKEWLNGVSNNNPDGGNPIFTKAKGASCWDDPDLGYYDGIPSGWDVYEY